MRLTLLFTVLIRATTLHAQLSNGSFEEFNGIQFPGWNYTCPCDLPAASADTPGGTGQFSLDLTAESTFCPCEVTFDLYQDLPWLTPGVWTLSYWIKGHTGFGPPAGVAVAYRTGLGYPPLSNQQPGVTDPTWTFHQDVFNWDGIYPELDSLLLMIAGGAAHDGEQHPRYDDIQLTTFATGIAEGGPWSEPAFRPNPATDKLWIDIAEIPTSIFCVDARGREIPLRTFRQIGGTVEVDVSDVPPGLCVILMNTSSGMRMLRYIKT